MNFQFLFLSQVREPKKSIFAQCSVSQLTYVTALRPPTNSFGHLKLDKRTRRHENVKKHWQLRRLQEIILTEILSGETRNQGWNRMTLKNKYTCNIEGLQSIFI